MNWFTKLFGLEPIDHTPSEMTFHLYNNNVRLRGTCGFVYICTETNNNGEPMHVYAVAFTSPDKLDRPMASKSMGHIEVNNRLDDTLTYYNEHMPSALSVIRNGGVAWRDHRSCIIGLSKMISSANARQTIYDAICKHNDMASSVPSFLKRLRTRSEIHRLAGGYNSY